MTDQERLLAEIERVEDGVRVMIEFGLFAGGAQADADAITEHLRLSREAASKSAPATASAERTHAEAKLSEALYSRSFLWRWIHLHQLPLLLYHLGTLALIAWMISDDSLSDSVLWDSVPVYIVTIGATGAILRGIWWLVHHVARRSFRLSFIASHLSAPIIGGLLGVVSFLICKSGLLVAGASPGSGSAYFLQTVAFLAGFSWQWITGRMDQLLYGGGALSNRPKAAS